MRLVFLLIALATSAMAQYDQPGPDDQKRPSDCFNCQKGPESVCDSCVTTLQPYSSIIPAQTYSWVHTAVYCTGRASQTATCTAPGSKQTWSEVSSSSHSPDFDEEIYILTYLPKALDMIICCYDSLGTGFSLGVPRFPHTWTQMWRLASGYCQDHRSLISLHLSLRQSIFKYTSSIRRAYLPISNPLCKQSFVSEKELWLRVNLQVPVTSDVPVAVLLRIQE